MAELESYLSKEQPLVQAVSESSETPPSVPVLAMQQQLLGVIQKVVEWVEKLEMKLSRDHEQYMRLPRKFQGQGLEDEDSLSHATDVGKWPLCSGMCSCKEPK